MKKTAVAAAILLACLAVCLAAQENVTDEAAIRAIIDRFGPMWTTSDGVEVFRSIASENFRFISANAILDREEFVQLLSNMLKENPPVRHSHAILKIVIANAFAVEYGTMELVRKNGQTTRSDSINIFFREASGWRFIGNLPAAEIRKVIAD
jgi:hypothetical protein